MGNRGSIPFEIAALWGEGASLEEISERSGESLADVALMLERAGVQAAKGKADRVSARRSSSRHSQERAKGMYERYASGETLQEVGDFYGVTRERVRQILSASGFSTKEARKQRGDVKRRAREARVVARLRETRNIQAVAREFNMTVGEVRKLAETLAPEAKEEVKNGSRVPNGYWTKARILDAIQRWVKQYGAPPHATDWNIAAIRARGYAEREERFINGLWPGVNTVRTKFGNWNDAIAEAGCDPTPVSSYGRPGDDRETVAEGMHLYRKGLSLNQAAAKVGISSATPGTSSS